MSDIELQRKWGQTTNKGQNRGLSPNTMHILRRLSLG